MPSSFGSGNTFFKGGGIVHIKATDAVRVDGSINVDGASVGGSGGSIYIKADSFAGQGQLSAKGGSGNSSFGKSYPSSFIPSFAFIFLYPIVYLVSNFSFNYIFNSSIYFCIRSLC